MIKTFHRYLSLLLIISLISAQFGCSGNSTGQASDTTESSEGRVLPVLAAVSIGYRAFRIVHGLVGTYKDISSILETLDKPDVMPATPIDNVLKEIGEAKTLLAIMKTEIKASYLKLQISDSEIMNAVSQTPLNAALTDLGTIYNNFEPQKVGDKYVRKTSSAASALQILNESTGVDSQLNKINDAILGNSTNPTGSIDALLAELVAKSNSSSSSDASMNAYYILETYFSSLLLQQAKGLYLLQEAYAYALANPKAYIVENGDKYQLIDTEQSRIKGTTVYKSVDQKINEYKVGWFDKHIDAQMQRFLSCVEKLVTDYNLKEDVFAGSISPQAASIFMRADFIATQWLNRNGAVANLIVRVIGEPERLKAYSEEWASVVFKQKFERTTSTFSVAEERHYAQWPPAKNIRYPSKAVFSEAATIELAKFRLLRANPGSEIITTNNDGTITGKLAYYNSNMIEVLNPSEDEKMHLILYGSILVIAKKSLKDMVTWNGDETLMPARSPLDSAFCGEYRYDYSILDIKKIFPFIGYCSPPKDTFNYNMSDNSITKSVSGYLLLDVISSATVTNSSVIRSSTLEFSTEITQKTAFIRNQITAVISNDSGDLGGIDSSVYHLWSSISISPDKEEYNLDYGPNTKSIKLPVNKLPVNNNKEFIIETGIDVSNRIKNSFMRTGYFSLNASWRLDKVEIRFE